jgi:hypothetical protein
MSIIEKARFLMNFSLGRVGALSIALSVTLTVSLLTLASSYSTPPVAHSAEACLAHPSRLPKDVFDLPFFNQYRQPDGKLALAPARSALAFLSDTDLPAAQQLFDVTAWKAFVALNWAAKQDGEPDPSKGFTDTGTPRVWEYWRQSSEVFRPQGKAPIPWLDNANTHDVDHFKAGWRQTSTVDQGKEAFSGPLIDQNGRWVHYQAFINRPEFDYLVKNELYNLEGQAAYTKQHTIAFPLNDDTHHGAVEIKLAWKVLTENEIKSGRFFTRRLPVVQYRPAGTPANVTPKAHISGKPADNDNSPPSKVETLGLIGMHIAMRTQSSPQWIWATFEQIDNTHLDPHSGSPKHPLPKRASLSNADDPEALVYANTLPDYNAVGADGKLSDWDESKPLPPVEVLRVVSPPPVTQQVNELMQAYLGSKKSVFRFYELVGTQWPRHPQAPAVAGGQGSAPESVIHKTPGDMVPVYLVNSTMETYFQKGIQDAGPLEQDDRVPFSIDTTKVFGTESCAGCHYSAGAAIGFRKDRAGNYLRDANGNKVPIFGENSHDGLSANANFSWMLQIEAQSKEAPKP